MKETHLLVASVESVMLMAAFDGDVISIAPADVSRSPSETPPSISVSDMLNVEVSMRGALLWWEPLDGRLR